MAAALAAGIQALGVLSVALYVAVVITIVFQLIKHTIGLRADLRTTDGLDVSEHGLLTAYGGFAMLPDTTALDGDAAAAPVQVPGDVPPAERCL